MYNHNYVEVLNMNNNGERTLVSEFYDNPNDFLEELKMIPVRKLVEDKDKKLIQKLKRWVREYWNSDTGMDLYESQARRIKEMLNDLGIESKIKEK